MMEEAGVETVAELPGVYSEGVDMKLSRVVVRQMEWVGTDGGDMPA
jgi:hypothetical protein